jgi:hypothetical protein
MNFIANCLFIFGMFCVLILAISGFVHLVNDDVKQCQVTFKHNDRVIVHIGEWK